MSGIEMVRPVGFGIKTPTAFEAQRAALAQPRATPWVRGIRAGWAEWGRMARRARADHAGQRPIPHPTQSQGVALG